MMLGKCVLSFLSVLLTVSPALAASAPKLVQQDGRYHFEVDGKPFFILGAQINNSSSWPSTLPEVWPTVEAMHVNTVEAPVYWEQLEPHPGSFDFSMVDMLVSQAREHHVQLVLLWFGTWKNGEDHYVPEWMKADTIKYPRMIDERGEPIQVLSANSPANLQADSTAFAAMMRHLKQLDAEQHTVILVQVENESGAIGAVRDHSAMAEKQFDGTVPSELVSKLHKSPGTWKQVFGPDADETFQAYSVSHYISQVAAAGKREFDIPMYCNVWMQYPRGYEIRGRDVPGYTYPSGGAVQTMLDVWKASATAIDMIGPDIYTPDLGAYATIASAYHRPDNPLWIPETGSGDNFASTFFLALGSGLIGYSPFGVDGTDWTYAPGKYPEAHAANYKLIAPMEEEISRLVSSSKLQTAVEHVGQPETTLHFGDYDAFVGFGYPQPDGEAHAPGTKEHTGRLLVAQLGPDEFLVAGFEGRVTFRLARPSPTRHLQIMRAEQGHYEEQQWHADRILNGDQTDRGVNLKDGEPVVHIRLGVY
jgi:hypothetical protein